MVNVVALNGGSIEDATDAQGTISLCSGTAPGQLTGDGTGTSALGSGGTGVANQITYQWQSTTVQNSWGSSDISLETGSDLNFTDLVTNGTPVWVRRVATNLGIEAYSNELKFEAPALPSPTATATDATVAPGGSTTLGVGTYSSYSWSDGSTVISTSQNPSTGAINTETTFTVTVADAAGCTGTSSVTVSVAAFVAGTTSGDVTYCNGATPTDISSTAPASGGSGSSPNYQWQSNTAADFSGSLVNLSTTLDYTFSTTPGATTYYRRRAEDPTNTGTYVYTNVVTYTDHTPAAITATADLTTVPPGASVQLSLTGEGGGTNTYVWSSSAGTTKDVTVTPTTPTTYTVTVTDAQSCGVVS